MTSLTIVIQLSHKKNVIPLWIDNKRGGGFLQSIAMRKKGKKTTPPIGVCIPQNHSLTNSNVNRTKERGGMLEQQAGYDGDGTSNGLARAI